MSSALLQFVSAVCKLAAIIAALALLLVVFVIMTEVVMRALHIPLVGGIEITRVTFLIAVFFAFAHVILKERDIRVDLVRSFFPAMIMRFLDVAASVISALFFGFMLVFSFAELRRAIEGGVYMEGRLLLPMWLPWGTIVIGSALAVLASLAMAFRYMSDCRPSDADSGPSERSSQIS